MTGGNSNTDGIFNIKKLLLILSIKQYHSYVFLRVLLETHTKVFMDEVI